MTTALCVLAAGDEEEATRATRVREAWAGVRFAAGVHPHNAAAFAGRAADAASVSRSREASLRRARGRRNRSRLPLRFLAARVQREVFEAQVALALELDARSSSTRVRPTDDTFACSRTRRRRPGRLPLLYRRQRHGPARAGRGVLAVVCRNRDVSRRRRSAGGRASMVPGDRLLVETDSPYLAPVPFRGKRNEPAHVGRVARTAGRASRRHREALAAQTRDNFDRSASAARPTRDLAMA